MNEFVIQEQDLYPASKMREITEGSIKRMKKAFRASIAKAIHSEAISGNSFVKISLENLHYTLLSDLKWIDPFTRSLADLGYRFVFNKTERFLEIEW